MDTDPSPLAFLLVPALIATSAYFVATEFALLTLRRGRMDAGGKEGERRPLPPGRLDELTLAAQLGNSLATLGLGAVVARLAHSLLPGSGGGSAARLALAFSIAALAHVVLHHQIPKLAGVQRTAALTGTAALFPVRLFAWPLRPLLWLLGWLASAGARLVGLSRSTTYPLAHTPEEIRALVSQGHEQGVVEEDEREMIHGVFEFTETVAREVMTPRIDIVAVPVEISLDDLLRVVVEEGHSRLPVYEETIDSVIGVLLAKDLIPLLWQGDRAHSFEVRAVMREPYFVPDTKPVDDILAEFRRQSVHLAIVLDEFGGTSGLVTMEDLLEEIVGEINDEYDVAEEEEFAPTPEGDVLIDGGAAISEVNERFGLTLPEADFDTIGGYIFGALGRVPEAGDCVVAPGDDPEACLQVEEIEDRRVLRVRLTRQPVPSEVAGEE